MKDMKQMYVPVLIFAGLILFFVALSYGGYGGSGFKSRHNLGYTSHNANNGSIVINSASFIKVLNLNQSRIFMSLCNDSELSDDEKIYVNYRTVNNSVDNSGLILWGGQCISMPSHSIYTGEITAISTTGNPILTYLEY